MSQSGLEKFFLNILCCLLQLGVAMIRIPVKMDIFYVLFQIFYRNRHLLPRDFLIPNY